ncbi:MAG: glutathione S-transferase family protein [Thermoanaerobaculia bacterium]|nr:glutathione S-transferase family protein [Thermoanaerobaculia bacterium]
MPEIKLYEMAPTRSLRCRWTLAEAGLEYESLGGRPDIIGSDELKQFHPLGKLPAAIIDGKPLFESAAICTAIADLAPEKELIAKPGTWGRALHDQWTCYVLTEMEAWLWASAVNTFVLPAEERIAEVLPQCAKLFARGAAGLEAALSRSDYLVEDRFTVTDIIAGYTVNWAKGQDLLGDFPSLEAYLDRLLAREHCPLAEG